MGNDEALRDSRQLIDEVFGQGQGLSYSSDFDVSHEVGLDGWWKSISSKGAVSLAERKKEKVPARSSKPSKEDSADTDDFEVADTPPHTRTTAKRGKESHNYAADEETESEEDSPSQIPDSHPSEAAPKPAPAKKGKLGGIEGKKKQASPAKSATPEPAQNVPTGGADSDTASEADAPPSPKPAATPKRRLGAIGGKRKTAEVEGSQANAGSQGSPGGGSQKPRRKLGHLGNKAASSPSKAEDESDENAEGLKPKGKGKAGAKKPVETEEERADRRRAELQQNPEKKVAAGPAKKKRKF